MSDVWLRRPCRISSIVTADCCYIPGFPFGRANRTTKQFLHLHAWKDTVSLTPHLDTLTPDKHTH